MNDFDILFGYFTDSGMTTFLHTDGTLVYQTGRRFKQDDRCIKYRITPDCLRQIKELIDDRRHLLTACAAEINRNQAFAGENYFLFDGIHIIDWDLTRWYLEEDRKKHPEYYSNSVKVELTETHVRALFDEICSLIERDAKELLYTRTVLTLP